MREPCSCAAMHSHDYPSVRNHCLQYFRPDGWEYCETSPNGWPALYLTGRCFLCGGSIDVGMPVPSGFSEQGERFHFLYHQIRTWRPYAVGGPSKDYPAASDRLNWYRMQNERTEEDWGRLMLQLLPEHERGDAKLWLSGYGKRRAVLNADAWPVGAVTRFKYELTVNVAPHIGASSGKSVAIHPLQELKITKFHFGPDEIIYSGLVKVDGETLYLEQVSDEKLYSQSEWSALLPERLNDPFAIGAPRDFAVEMPPPAPAFAYVLTRTMDISGIHTKVLAAAETEELLMDQISEDVGKLAAQDVIPVGLPFETAVEGDLRNPEERCYRHFHLDSLGRIEYAIRAVPYRSAVVDPTEGGAA